MDEGGSRNGASLSEEAHCGGLLLLGTLGYERKALGTGISLQMGNLEWARLPGTLKDG